MNKKHPFTKSFLGSKATQAGSGTAVAVQSGFVNATGLHHGDLAKTGAPFTLGPGVFGLFEWGNRLSVNAASAAVTTGKPLLIAMSSPFSANSVGNNHGYQGSFKSKQINPRYITKFERWNCEAPENAVCHLGNTNFTSTTTLAITTAGAGYTDGVYSGVGVTGGTGAGMLVTVTIVGGEVTAVEDVVNGAGYVAADVLTLVTTPEMGSPTTPAEFTVDEYGSCNYDFFCGETYDIIVGLSGSPVLSVFNHEVPRRFSAYTGCCPEGTVGPQRVDSTLVFIAWAKAIIESDYTRHFVRPIVYDQNQNPLFATSAEAVAAGYASTDTWDNYVSPGYIAGSLGGIRFEGAYVDTQFGNCSFKPEDSYIVDPIKIDYIQVVDQEGVPCQKQLCFVCERLGYVGRGQGEGVLRYFLHNSELKQFPFAENVRYREIEQADEWLSLINRNTLYTRYVIEHMVPIADNSSADFSPEIYQLNIFIPCSGATTPTVTAFEGVMAAWLSAVNSTVSLVTYNRTAVTVTAI